MESRLDELDREILRELQADARISKAELARRVSLSPPGLSKRLKKLEKAEIIQGYGAELNWSAVGWDLLCFVHINFDHHDPDMVRAFEERMRSIPEVLECHHITGEYDYLVKAVVRNRRHLETFLTDNLTPVREVRWLRTSVVLREVKSSTVIPLDGNRTPHERNGEPAASEAAR